MAGEAARAAAARKNAELKQKLQEAASLRDQAEAANAEAKELERESIISTAASLPAPELQSLQLDAANRQRQARSKKQEAVDLHRQAEKLDQECRQIEQAINTLNNLANKAAEAEAEAMRASNEL